MTGVWAFLCVVFVACVVLALAERIVMGPDQGVRAAVLLLVGVFLALLVVAELSQP